MQSRDAKTLFYALHLPMVATLLSVFTLFAKNMADPRAERTFIAVKPDGVQRGLIGEIISRFEKRGYKLVAGKLIWVSLAIDCSHASYFWIE